MTTQNGSIDSIAVADVPRVPPTASAGDALRGLLLRSYASAGDIVLVEAGRPVGLVPLEALLSADSDVPVRELSRGEPPSAPEGADPEAAAVLAARSGARTVAVIDARGRLKGLVPPEKLLAVLLEEHEEDMARLGGSLRQSSAARRASEEPVRRRLWHRLPWLALGLAGAMLSAAIVASFEEELRAEVLLAFFVPAVVYMADAVGTQTETVVIRGMSLGVPIARVAARELVTGLVMGALIAVAFFAFALAVWGEARVAAVVALSLLVSTSLATAVAMALPYALARLGRDPAFGSGPLATVIQDLLSIAAYFSIAVLLLR